MALFNTKFPVMVSPAVSTYVPLISPETSEAVTAVVPVTRPYVSVASFRNEPVPLLVTVARSIVSALTTIREVDAVPTLNALPLCDKPAPAVNEPPAENCTNTMASVPTVVIAAVCVQPVSAFAVPNETNTAAEFTSSSGAVWSKSVARVQAPAATTYTPFCEPVV